MKKTVLIVIRVVCIVGFLVCAGVLGWYWHSDRSDRAVAEALAAAHDAASAAAIEQVRAVAADNADTIGWLRIDGTNINNVVMFAPDTPGKYLHMDFYGKWSYRGTLYVAENCDVRTAENILIYGHHMKDGSMFGSLISYKDAAFRAAHPFLPCPSRGHGARRPACPSPRGSVPPCPASAHFRHRHLRQVRRPPARFRLLPREPSL